MNVLTDERHAVVADLLAAGLHATADPERVLAISTSDDVCVLVEPPESYARGMGDVRWDIPVRLITAGPLDPAAVERLEDALLVALPVVMPNQPVVRTTYAASDADMPALLIQAPRVICP